MTVIVSYCNYSHINKVKLSNFSVVIYLLNGKRCVAIWSDVVSIFLDEWNIGRVMDDNSSSGLNVKELRKSSRERIVCHFFYRLRVIRCVWTLLNVQNHWQTISISTKSVIIFALASVNFDNWITLFIIFILKAFKKGFFTSCRSWKKPSNLRQCRPRSAGCWRCSSSHRRDNCKRKSFYTNHKHLILNSKVYKYSSFLRFIQAVSLFEGAGFDHCIDALMANHPSHLLGQNGEQPFKLYLVVCALRNGTVGSLEKEYFLIRLIL